MPVKGVLVIVQMELCATVPVVVTLPSTGMSTFSCWSCMHRSCTMCGVNSTGCTIVCLSFVRLEVVLTWTCYRFSPTRFVHKTIECSTSLFGDVDPAPGIRKTCDCHPGTPNTPFFSQPDVQQVEKNIFESDINIRKTRGDACGPHMQYSGFFRAPVAGNYSFLLSSDDGAQLWGKCVHK